MSLRKELILMKKMKLLTIILSATFLSGTLAGCSCFGSSCYGSSNGGGSTAAQITVEEESNGMKVTEENGITTYEFDDGHTIEYDEESGTYKIGDYVFIEPSEETEEDVEESDDSDKVYPDIMYGEKITVGSDAVGYIDIPADCYEFTDAGNADPNMIQYCYQSPYNVVTLTCYDEPGMTSYDIAQIFVSSFQSDTAYDPDSFSSSIVEFAGIEAYEIVCYYPADAQWLAMYIFDSPYDEYIHYVGIEMTEDAMDFAGMIEATYRFRNE